VICARAARLATQTGVRVCVHADCGYVLTGPGPACGPGDNPCCYARRHGKLLSAHGVIPRTVWARRA